MKINWLLLLLLGLFSCKDLEDFDVEYNESISGELYQDMSAIGLYERAHFGGYFTYADISLLTEDNLQGNESIYLEMYIDGNFEEGYVINPYSHRDWLSKIIGVDSYSGTHEVILAVYLGSINQPQDKSNGLLNLLGLDPGVKRFKQRLHFDQSWLDDISVTRQEIIGDTGYAEWEPSTARNFAFYRIYNSRFVHDLRPFDPSEYIIDRNQTSIEVKAKPGEIFILEHSNRLEKRVQNIYF